MEEPIARLACSEIGPAMSVEERRYKLLHGAEAGMSQTRYFSADDRHYASSTVDAVEHALRRQPN